MTFLPMYRPTDERLARRAYLVGRAWIVLVVLAGVCQFGIGIGFVWDIIQSPAHGGPGPIPFRGSVFRASDTLSPMVWAIWAVVGGLCMLVRGPLRFLGVTSTVAWYALWWALLATGVFMAGGPHYSISVYGFLTALHIVLWTVEFLSANPWTDRKPRDVT